jgi:metal-responsive CopG/Arc/MetJ family transcriptional regulator
MPSERRLISRVELNFDPVEVREIDRLAGKWHLSRSQFIRDAVAAYIEGAQNEERRELHTTFRRALRVLELKEEAPG